MADANNQIPPEYRVYISQGDVNYYSQHGVKIYHGSRGGIYVDLRELQRKGLSYVGSKDKEEVGRSKEDAVLNLVRNNAKYRSEYLGVVGVVRKNVVHGIREAIQKGENISTKLKNGADVVSATNRVVDFFDSADLSKEPVDVLTLDDLGVSGGAHSSVMKIYVFEDGSKVFAKEVRGGYYNRSYLLNNVFSSAILKIIGKAVVPVGRIIKDSDGVYVGVSEVFGVDINTFGYGLEAIKKAVENGFIEPNKDFVEGLVSGMVVGLADVFVHNFMIDTDSNRIVFYDLDFTNVAGSDLLMILEWFVENGYVTNEDIGEMFKNIWLENKDDIYKVLGQAYEYVRMNVGDSEDLEKIYNRWREWFDDVDELVNAVDDVEILGTVLMNGGWRT